MLGRFGHLAQAQDGTADEPQHTAEAADRGDEHGFAHADRGAREATNNGADRPNAHVDELPRAEHPAANGVRGAGRDDATCVDVQDHHAEAANQLGNEDKRRNCFDGPARLRQRHEDPARREDEQSHRICRPDSHPPPDARREHRTHDGPDRTGAKDDAEQAGAEPEVGCGVEHEEC